MSVARSAVPLRLAREADGSGWPGPFVLDELPYLLAADPTLTGVLQAWVDATPGRPSVVVSGSSQRMMHGAVLAADAPLYGRAREAFEPAPAHRRGEVDVAGGAGAAPVPPERASGAGHRRPGDRAGGVRTAGGGAKRRGRRARGRRADGLRRAALNALTLPLPVSLRRRSRPASRALPRPPPGSKPDRRNPRADAAPPCEAAWRDRAEPPGGGRTPRRNR